MARGMLSNASIFASRRAPPSRSSDTGSGKTTLAHLVPRLIDPSVGAVTVDDIDVRILSGRLARAIGYVPQETFLSARHSPKTIAFGVENARRTTSRTLRTLLAFRPILQDFQWLPDHGRRTSITLSAAKAAHGHCKSHPPQPSHIDSR